MALKVNTHLVPAGGSNNLARPGTKLKCVRAMVVHNPGTSGCKASSVYNTYDGRARGGDDGRTASTQYVIGPDGEIVMTIPEDEVSYNTPGKWTDNIFYNDSTISAL